MKLSDLQRLYWSIAVVIALSFVMLPQGCKQSERPTDSNHSEWQGLRLEPGEGLNLQGKTTSVKITATGLDAQGNPTIRHMIEATIPNPVFPLDVPFPLYEPPCCWRITVTVTPEDQPQRVITGDVNVCEETMLELIIN